jgi:hypothetical protein
MRTRNNRLTILIIVVGFIASFAMGQNTRQKMKPLTDGVSHTSGVNGKWVKGCPPTPCNMGVGNLGPANTYHWEGP